MNFLNYTESIGFTLPNITDDHDEGFFFCNGNLGNIKKQIIIIFKIINEDGMSLV